MTLMTALSAMSPEIPAMTNNCNMTTSPDFLVVLDGISFAQHFRDSPEKLRFGTGGG